MSKNGKITVGIDIGSTTSKAVVLQDGKYLAGHISMSTINPSKTAEDVYHLVLQDAGIAENDVDYILGTGYGRSRVAFADSAMSEITCHAKGAFALVPECRTIIDIGGQDTKVITLDENGLLQEFVMNDKCAAGTGRFLEVMSRSLNLTIAEMMELDEQGTEAAMISSICSVFAESEVISMINENVPVPNIIKGLHKSIAVKVLTLTKRAGLKKEVVMTGGVAKNTGVVRAIENEIGFKLASLPDYMDPQLVGAFGAAISGLNKKRETTP